MVNLITPEFIHTLSPFVLVVLGFAWQYKVFMTPAEFQKERADFIQWIAEHYVSDKTYRENHKALQQELHDMRQDLSDIKNILIERR